MKRLYAIALIAGLAGAGWWLYAKRPGRSAQGPHVAGSLRADSDLRSGNSASRALDPDAAATIKSLEEKLRQKDQLLQGLILRQAFSAEDKSMTVEEKEARLMKSAVRLLDQRLFEAAQDEAEVARLEASVGQVTRRLPKDVKTELACGPTLCRLVFRGAAPAVGQATSDVVEGVPKLFVGTVVLPTAEGESTMYLARDSALLDLSATRAPGG